MSKREYSDLSRAALQKARKAGCMMVYGDGSIKEAELDVRCAEMIDPYQQRLSIGEGSGFSDWPTVHPGCSAR